MNIKLWDSEAEVYVTYYVSMWAERDYARVTVYDESQTTEYYDADIDVINECIEDGWYTFDAKSIAQYVHDNRKAG